MSANSTSQGMRTFRSIPRKKEAKVEAEEDQFARSAPSPPHLPEYDSELDMEHIEEVTPALEEMFAEDV